MVDVWWFLYRKIKCIQLFQNNYSEVIWDFRFPWLWLWRWLSFGMLCHVVCTHRPDDGGSKHFWNINQYLPDYTAQHSRRWSSALNFVLWLKSYSSVYKFASFSWFHVLGEILFIFMGIFVIITLLFCSFTEARFCSFPLLTIVNNVWNFFNYMFSMYKLQGIISWFKLCYRTNFEATPPPILIDNGLAVLENEKIERHIMKNVPGGHNLFVQDKEVATLVENLYSVSQPQFLSSSLVF
jgi:hypothetical protein